MTNTQASDKLRRMQERQAVINRSKRLAESARIGRIMDKHGVVGCPLPCNVCK